MKKYVTILLSLMFLVSVSVIAHALHERIVPYEGTFGHYKTMPIPSGGDVRYHIAGHMNYKDWAQWPGKGEMFKGTEPHGALLTTYVNDIARKSIKKMKGMANNSIIVKENYAPNKKLIAITVMYKVKGYNPEKGDWFWVKYDSKFDILAEGKVKDCLNCHSTVKDNDYIFGGRVTGK